MIIALITAAAIYVIPPPAKWDHGPTLAPPDVIMEPQSDVQRACSRWDKDPKIFDGCTILWPERCEIHLRIDGPLDKLMAHELAHCRGWPADHPQ